MPQAKKRQDSARDPGSLEGRLARLFDTPVLARVVPHLAPETLHQVIQLRGLDACGELVTSATPAQLGSVLDLDLWRQPRPGFGAQFDVDRFGEWLEVLVDAGSSVAARTVAALDRNVVVAGLSRYVRVLDPGIFEPTAQSDDEPIDRHEAMREGDRLDVGETADWESNSAGDASTGDGLDGLECELGGYIIRARRADAWDAIVTLLVALDTEHGDCFHAVMQGCRALSNSRSEIDGLHDLLLAPEQHLHDVTIERERRRSQQGYATPADARAFLQMARQRKHAGLGEPAGSTRLNPIVAAYFRAADEAPSNETSPPESAPESPSSGPPLAAMPLPTAASGSGDVHAEDASVRETLDAVVELLTEAGAMPARPRGLFEAADGDPQVVRLAHFRRLMSYVRDTHEAAYFARSRELAFLANTLLAGCSLQSRPFTPQEASAAAAAICNLGLGYWPSRWPGVTAQSAPSGRAHDTAAASQPYTSPPDSLLIDQDLVMAFEVGWSALYEDVSLFVAEQLIATLTEVDCIDRDVRLELVAFRRTLEKHRDAGTPWHAREAAEVLAMLDMAAWISVLGLLNECPVIPMALTAVLEGRTTTVSQTAFDFISTAAQIENIRSFMRRLPGVLSG